MTRSPPDTSTSGTIALDERNHDLPPARPPAAAGDGEDVLAVVEHVGDGADAVPSTVRTDRPTRSASRNSSGSEGGEGGGVDRQPGAAQPGRGGPVADALEPDEQLP